MLSGFRDLEIRKRMGAIGGQKMARDFSWESIARHRLRDYEAALNRRGRREEGLVPEKNSLTKEPADSDPKHRTIADLREKSISDV